MDRKQFEEWFKTTLSYAIFEDSNVWKVDLYAFNGPTNSYLHSGVQSAFESWQHQQAKVEELQNKLQSTKESAYKAGFYDGRNGTPCEYVRLEAEREELQKRVDLQQKLLGIYRTLSEDQLDNCADNLIARINGLEQALKGGLNE